MGIIPRSRMEIVKNAPLIVCIALLLIGVAISVAPNTASAQTAEAKAEAGKHFQRGVELYSSGNYEGALEEFLEAYNIAPNWRVRYNIGQIHFQLKDYAEAIREFRRYLEEGSKELSPERKDEVSKSVAKLRMEIGSVSVDANVRGARVLIDGREAGTTPLEPYIVNLGRHRVAVEAPGFFRQERIVQVSLDGTEEWTVELRPTDGSPPPARVAADETSDDVRSTPRGSASPSGTGGKASIPWFAVGAGAVAAIAAGTAVAFGAMALGTSDALGPEIIEPDATRDDSLIAVLKASLDDQLTATTILAGVAGAAGIVTVIAVLVSGGSKTDGATTVGISPFGVSLNHRF